MRLSEGDSEGDKCISTVCYCWVRACSSVLLLQISASSNVIGHNRYEVIESETPRLPRFELVCRQTLDRNLKADFERLILEIHIMASTAD